MKNITNRLLYPLNIYVYMSGYIWLHVTSSFLYSKRFSEKIPLTLYEKRK